MLVASATSFPKSFQAKQTTCWPNGAENHAILTELCHFLSCPGGCLIPSPPSSDVPFVKFFVCVALAASYAAADSHPSWWTLASPEATALVGIKWDNLQRSPFAPALEAELSGPLGFPDLDCLKHAREVVISAPEFLAMAAGNFPAASVNQQAQRAGLRRIVYKGITLWIPSAAGSFGVAQMSEQLLLTGTRKTMLGAIDRSQMESGRQYSNLLPRAARFSQTADLWVVAVKLPDPLASLFVPIDAAGTGFLGEISVRDGLSLDASFDAASTDAASKVAAALMDQAQTLPEFARGLEASSDRRTVSLELHVDADQLAAALQKTPIAPPAAPAAPAPVLAKAAAPTPAPVVVASAPVAVAPVKPAEPLKPVEPPKPIDPPKPPKPQVIRITGLDDGPREIVLSK